MTTAALFTACSDHVVFDDDGSTGNNVGAGGTGGSGGGGTGGTATGGGATTSNQVDVLFVVDNSRGTSHMQNVLASSVPNLVDGLSQAGVTDLHVGVISSSLGGQGADACTGAGSPTENDRAHLLSRGDDGAVPTYENLGFLAWDPNQTSSPPGEASATTFSNDAAEMIRGAGDLGCGFESQMESFYRFLVDPDPYANVELNQGVAVLTGTDNELLAQRDDFLRPDSLLMIVIATDENDCSTRAEGQFYFSRQVYQSGTNNPYHLPAPRAACATDPNSPCCASCGELPGDGCDESADQCNAPLSNLDDNLNLRCFDQKRRFGIDFLYPVDRYTQGLSSAQITDRYGDVVDNPLFAGGRGPELVLVAGVVGVPWQLVARGGTPSGGMHTGEELTNANAWGAIIGDPANYVPPSDAHMIESSDPRPGLPPPSADHDADPIHGHDHSIPQADDLQHACTWELREPVDCGANANNCPCVDPSNDLAVCQNPETGQSGTVQYRGVAKPGIRPLTLLESLGHRSVVGSVCPVQTETASAADFGYAPTFSTLVELAEKRLE